MSGIDDWRWIPTTLAVVLLAGPVPTHGTNRSLESEAEPLEASLSIQRRLADGSLDVAASLNNRHLIELHLSQGRAAEAFRILERSRARNFLEMLAERDSVFSVSVPGGTSPELAALRHPQPLDLAGAQKALDPGTVMLSYSVGESQVDLFAVATGDFKGTTSPLGEDELRREVELFRRLIQTTVAATDLTAEIESVGKRLYRQLIQPAQKLIDANQRILIVADGPLHLLPFAALVREVRRPDVPLRPTEVIAETQFVAQWRPIHSALSATVYAQLDRRPASTANSEILLAAFGDPIYDSESNLSPASQQRSVTGRELDLDLEALPASRSEVERIAKLFPSEQTRIFLGAQATEEQAKIASRQARMVHFATHGLLDQRFPLDSGLVLTPPLVWTSDRDNGLLQAWEIFEDMRLEADLVVLSACDSGLGSEQGGEGLMGLTRAFQYAGARSVVSTLWPVDDAVTAELMVRFYRHLQAGHAKNEALRAAQVELIEQPIQVPGADGEPIMIDASSPNYWAAFQITGSWR